MGVQKEKWRVNNKTRTVLVARENGKIKTWGLYSKVKGGFHGGLSNFQKYRSFKSIQEKPIMVERHRFGRLKNVVGTGRYTKAGNKPVPRPIAPIVSYSVIAVFKDGRRIYASSVNMQRAQFNEKQARDNAYLNLYKNVSPNYDSRDGREIVNSSRPEIYEGWVTYERSQKKIVAARSQT